MTTIKIISHIWVAATVKDCVMQNIQCESTLLKKDFHLYAARTSGNQILLFSLAGIFLGNRDDFYKRYFILKRKAGIEEIKHDLNSIKRLYTDVSIEYPCD
jgi:hypothetical protein